MCGKDGKDEGQCPEKKGATFIRTNLNKHQSKSMGLII